MPYAFYNESFGFAGAYAYAVTGWPQKQSALIATAMAGSQGSAMGFMMAKDYRIPYTKRLFLDAIVQAGYFQENEIYIDGNPDFQDERAGSNDSDEDDFVESDGTDNFFRLRFKYLLPIGHGKDQIISTQVVDRGLLVDGATGGESWNPLTSGLTYIEMKPFYRKQEVDSDDVREDVKTNGLEVSLFRDNRDFKPNPSKGNALRLKFNRDFGWLDSSDSWTVVDGNLTSIFHWESRTGSVSACWPLISGRPIPRPGMKQAMGKLKTGRRPLPVPPWEGSGVCVVTRPSASVIKRRFTMQLSYA
ncbi:MAG: hypothetical protein PVI49_10670 [Desulfobacterales bacterium]